ncbi:MAG TPA: glycosyltransferase family 4 protein [Candidatus Saccharimonadales bacterium]|nr:glycosyltransferase family 4 protein [Candidatus Saccharimonadales bacterium]
MKILMLGWELPPHNSGGLGIACYQLCKALSKNDVDIEFILPYEADHQIDFMRVTAASPQGVATVLPGAGAYDSQRYILPDGSEHHLGIHDQQRLYEQNVARLTGSRQIDIVHAHDWLTFRAALRVKEAKGCPVILHVHSVESDRAGGLDRGNPLVKEVEGLSMQLADKVVAVSRHTKQRIIEDYHIPADKIEVVHNSIDPDGLAPLEPDNAYHYLTLMKQLGYKVVVNVGRLTIQKGLPNLLKAMREVITREPKSLLLIVGSGEQYRELVELAAELGIGPNVLFTDFQRGKRWRDAFAIGDLFVMPSVSEPFGLTPLEAAGYGTPSLISKQSGVSEVLHSCLKTDFWDINEMANQIIATLRSDALRGELRDGAYREYQRLSWDTVSDRMMDLYAEHVPEAAV